ncbi:MAG: putative Ig domain-containing protein, partial [Solirubrobacteraceae bacterium]
VKATGRPTPALAESGALPAGVTFTDRGDGTAALAGTPAPGSAGTYPIGLTAANGNGSATRTVTLTVAGSAG